MIALIRCVLFLAWSVHVAVKLGRKKGRKNHVPERIRAAGFTELRLRKPQRDDLTTNRQGLGNVFST